MSAKEIRSVALTTYFKHHAKHGGYAQVLNYTRPVKIFGIDENTEMPSRFRQKYQWMYEFDAARYAKRNNIDIIHILYGEDYFRFSHLVAGTIPVISTFHQPAEMLERDVHYGNLRGRVGRLTHFFTSGRFKKLAAAIVLSNSQKDVLKKVMPEEKIAVIPHGVALDYYTSEAARFEVNRSTQQILTVGQWMRDWDFYFEFLSYCREKNIPWIFHLVNRTLPEQYKRVVGDHPNLVYHEGASDSELIKLYLQSAAQFLPVHQAAANNAVVESFALGCPVLMTDVVFDDFYDKNVLKYYKKNNLQSALDGLKSLLEMNEAEAILMSNRAVNAAAAFDWRVIGEQTLNLYRKVLSIAH
jgi:glycosyltransferase involved in cell wall biosynthesis